MMTRRSKSSADFGLGGMRCWRGEWALEGGVSERLLASSTPATDGGHRSFHLDYSTSLAQRNDR
jgi:hypothetical protein